jgi:hypothetical protein
MLLSPRRGSTPLTQVTPENRHGPWATNPRTYKEARVFKGNETLERAAVTMLDELRRWTDALAGCWG